jgi:hypothetical protein
MMWSVFSVLIGLVELESSLKCDRNGRKPWSFDSRDNIVQPKAARGDTRHTGDTSLKE